MVVVFAQHPVGREPQIIERGADAGQVVPGFRRQGERAVLPDEQAYPEFLLETFDLMADRGLRDVELGRRLREAQMPGGGLEGAQSIERRQSGGHFSHPLYMSLFHAKRYKVSFVECPDKVDIKDNKLALGDENVHSYT